MKPVKIILLGLLLATSISCTKKMEEIRSNFLINDKGWYSYEASSTDLVDGTDFTTNEPYIIIGEYGSGFRLSENGICFINYSDGSEPIVETSLTRDWELFGVDQIKFINQNSSDDNITATIVEISEDSFWIEYEQEGYLWEYKLKRIK